MPDKMYTRQVDKYQLILTPNLRTRFNWLTGMDRQGQVEASAVRCSKPFVSLQYIVSLGNVDKINDCYPGTSFVRVLWIVLVFYIYKIRMIKVLSNSLLLWLTLSNEGRQKSIIWIKIISNKFAHTKKWTICKCIVPVSDCSLS